MIGYITIGTNDFEKSKAFYEKALAALNVRKTFASDRMQGYGVKGQPVSLVVCKPYDGKPATHGNGEMVALAAPSREAVNQVHAAALAAGAADEGAPGIRTGTFYGAYFRDLDGNKICVFTTGS
ncbi:MAG: VOC family protein [Alphaproteobacteria bacterium]|nr:VOC family protein [Alphaproteobacteria bacterium]MBL7096226.1 VOC family protein [Alphaproteobacteria bacterium]